MPHSIEHFLSGITPDDDAVLCMRDCNLGCSVSTHTLVVSREYNGFESSGNYVQPFNSIQAAIDAIPTPTCAAEESEPWCILVGAGCYDEDLTIGRNIYLSIVCLGPVILGDGRLVNMGSTTPRNIYWNGDYGGYSIRRPSLSLGAVATTEANSYSAAYACGMVISGSIIMSSSTPSVVAHQLQLYNVVVQQNVIGTADINNCKMIIYRGGFEGTINAPNCDLGMAFRPIFRGPVTFNSFTNSIGGYHYGTSSVTISTGNLAMQDCNLRGTFTLPGGSGLRLSGMSYYYWKTNGCVLVGGSGITILEKISAPCVEYTPANAAHWNGSAPATIQAALDRIASKITPIP